MAFSASHVVSKSSSFSSLTDLSCVAPPLPAKARNEAMAINEYDLAYSIAWRAGYSKEDCEHIARKSCDTAINYPVPALADTATVLCLGHIANQWQYLAWDAIWRDDLPEYIR